MSISFQEDADLSNEMQMHLEEIHEYVMFKLHDSFFNNNTLSSNEIRL